MPYHYCYWGFCAANQDKIQPAKRELIEGKATPHKNVLHFGRKAGRLRRDDKQKNNSCLRFDMALKVCIVQFALNIASETFLRAHAHQLNADTTVVHRVDGLSPAIGSHRIPANFPVSDLKFADMGLQSEDERTVIRGYLEAFRLAKAQVILAEFGPIGVAVRKACLLAGIPFAVHFHGYDASRRDITQNLAAEYQSMFRDAAAVIAVSEVMRRKLLDLGADPAKTRVNPYGVDCHRFSPAASADARPIFLAVGRFVEKKAPHLTIAAFGEVLRQTPAAQLKMIGIGPLLTTCKTLATSLGISQSIEFLGEQSHDSVATEMRTARVFVQHSVEAPSGDSEGLPVAILEAGASGLPVVATRHAGIPEVVDHGVNGFLVEEGDVQQMAGYMMNLAGDASLARRLGSAARRKIEERYSIAKSISGLQAILTEISNEHEFDGLLRDE